MISKLYRIFTLVLILLQPLASQAQWETVPGYGWGNMIQLETAAQGRLFTLFQGGGLYRSDNHGLNWQLLRPAGTAPFNVQSFAITASGTLAALASGSVWYSNDMGESWNVAKSGFGGDGTVRTMAAAGDSVFVARYGLLFRISLESGQLTQVYSIEPDYKMYLFADGNELWVAPLQGNIRMTADHGQNWVHYPPDFTSQDICFRGDTVWGVPHSVPNNRVHFVVKGNTTEVFNRPLPIADTYAAMSAAGNTVFMVYPNRIYRYLPAGASWEVFLDSPNAQTHEVKISDGFQYISTGSGLLRRVPGDDVWNLCNTGIGSGSPSQFQHFDRYLFAYSTYYNGILPPTPGIWITPYEITTASIGKGPDGLYGCDNNSRLWYSEGNLHEWAHIGTAPNGIASRIFTVSDTLFAVGSGKEIFRSTDLGQQWDITGYVPVAQNSLFKRLLIADSMMYVCDDNMKFYRLNPASGQMEQRGTIPGDFVQDATPFDALPPAIFIRSNKLYYSPNEGQTWIAWPELDDQGQALLFQDFVASEAGFFGLDKFPAQIYYAAEPGDPFVRLAFPPMDTLVQPNSNAVNAIEYVDGYLYAAQKNGNLYRRQLDKLALNAYSGRIWRDDNINGQWDTTEAPVAALVTQRGDFRFGITDQTGRYTIFDDLDPDTLRAYIPWPGWTLHPPFRVAAPPGDTLDFRLVPPFFRNYCVDMSLYNPLRPGFPTNLNLTWQNLGAADSATLRFVFPGNLAQVLAASPAPDAVAGDTLIWLLNGIAPAESGSVSLQMKTDPGTPIGTIISLMAEILPMVGDEQPENNRRILGTAVVGSFDPNDKQAEPMPYTTLDLAARTPISYTIRFQNTGNYPASSVVIRDTIAGNLDLRSLQVMAASHPYRLSIVNGRVLEFHFNPIDLPDSTSNEPASHGFVKYNILPDVSVQAGNALYNTAYIYFDFNTPVQTNTVETMVVPATGTQHIAGPASLRISPNPASDRILVELPGDAPAEGSQQLYLFDGNGRAVRTVPANHRSVWLSVAGLPQGMYTLQWRVGAKLYVGKLLRL